MGVTREPALGLGLQSQSHDGENASLLHHVVVLWLGSLQHLSGGRDSSVLTEDLEQAKGNYMAGDKQTDRVCLRR